MRPGFFQGVTVRRLGAQVIMVIWEERVPSVQYRNLRQHVVGHNRWLDQDQFPVQYLRCRAPHFLLSKLRTITREHPLRLRDALQLNPLRRLFAAVSLVVLRGAGSNFRQFVQEWVQVFRHRCQVNRDVGHVSGRPFSVQRRVVWNSVKDATSRLGADQAAQQGHVINAVRPIHRPVREANIKDVRRGGVLHNARHVTADGNASLRNVGSKERYHRFHYIRSSVDQRRTLVRFLSKHFFGPPMGFVNRKHLPDRVNVEKVTRLCPSYERYHLVPVSQYVGKRARYLSQGQRQRLFPVALANDVRRNRFRRLACPSRPSILFKATRRGQRKGPSIFVNVGHIRGRLIFRVPTAVGPATRYHRSHRPNVPRQGPIMNRHRPHCLCHVTFYVL